MTALHVLNECSKVYRGAELAIGRSVDVDFNLHALQVYEGGKYTDWQVRLAASSNHSDLAWLQMSDVGPIPSVPLRPLRLTLPPPRVDARVLAVAYHAGVVIQGRTPIEIAIEPVSTQGRVVEVHLVKRGPSCLNFPASKQTRDSRMG